MILLYTAFPPFQSFELGQVRTLHLDHLQVRTLHLDHLGELPLDLAGEHLNLGDILTGELDLILIEPNLIQLTAGQVPAPQERTLEELPHPLLLSQRPTLPTKEDKK